MLLEHSKIGKSLACGSWCTNSSRVLPTSRVVYQPINHRNLWSIAQRSVVHRYYQNEVLTCFFWYLTISLSYPAVVVVHTIAEASAQCAGTTRWPTHRAGSGADSLPGSWCQFSDGAPLSRSRKRAIRCFIGARGLGLCTKAGISWWSLTRSW